MKMTKFEKFFVNSKGRSQRVADYAEKMLRLAGFAPGQSYLAGLTRIFCSPSTST
jgi:hypothetical protein